MPREPSVKKPKKKKASELERLTKSNSTPVANNTKRTRRPSDIYLANNLDNSEAIRLRTKIHQGQKRRYKGRLGETKQPFSKDDNSNEMTCSTLIQSEKEKPRKRRTIKSKIEDSENQSVQDSSRNSKFTFSYNCPHILLDDVLKKGRDSLRRKKYARRNPRTKSSSKKPVDPSESDYSLGDPLPDESWPFCEEDFRNEDQTYTLVSLNNVIVDNEALTNQMRINSAIEENNKSRKLEKECESIAEKLSEQLGEEYSQITLLRDLVDLRAVLDEIEQLDFMQHEFIASHLGKYMKMIQTFLMELKHKIPNEVKFKNNIVS